MLPDAASVPRRERLSLRAEALLRSNRPGRALIEIVEGTLEGDVLRAASAMAFDLFLAAIPLLALAGWLFGQLIQDGSAVHATSLLLDRTPEAVRSLAVNQLSRFSPKAFAPLALLGALWLSSSAAATGMSLLETRFKTRPRPWWRRRLIAIVAVLASITIFGVGSALALFLSGGPARLLVAVGSADVGMTAGHVVALGLVHLLAVALLAAFFRIAVDRPGVARRVFPGALLGSTLAVLASAAFTFYAAKIARFALYYGSLAAVAITLVWLWLVCLFLLVGAELNLLLEGTEPERPEPRA